MTDWFIIFLFFTRLGLFLAERAFFFFNGFCRKPKNGSIPKQKPVGFSLFFIYSSFFAPRNLSTGYALFLFFRLPFFFSRDCAPSFNPPTSILSRWRRFPRGKIGKSDFSIHRVCTVAYIRLVNGAEYIKSTRAIYILHVYVNIYIYIGVGEKAYA